MKTIGFFNNKGGVGKTSLAYHLTWMLGQLDTKVIAVDLDPQANLTSLFLNEERLDQIYSLWRRPTLHGAVSDQFRGVGDVRSPDIEEVTDRIGLLAGDLELSRFEDDLSYAWPKCLDGDERSFRVISAFARAIRLAGDAFQAAVALVDVGPNLGALNRSALLACDFVVVPLGADLLSLQGLRNMGPALRNWRSAWKERRSKNPDPTLMLPDGGMHPVGYVITRHSVTAGRPARAYARWIDRMPEAYRSDVLGDSSIFGGTTASDPNCLARLKDYRSLMPLAQEARKPMFLLRPADGAFGGHQQAVADCYQDFKRLAQTILDRCLVPA